MICDALEHLNRYRGLHQNLDTAIDYLTAYHVARDLYDLPLGRTEVDGENVFIKCDGGRFEPRQHPPRIPQKSTLTFKSI